MTFIHREKVKKDEIEKGVVRVHLTSSREPRVPREPWGYLLCGF